VGSIGRKIVGAVEIGTGKIVALVGEVVHGRSLNIIGMGIAASHGIIKGEVVDNKAASEATHHALEQAERQAGVPIEEVWLAMSGGKLDAFYNEASVNVRSSENTVTTGDIAAVCRMAKERELPEGRMPIHYIRQPFRLDGQSMLAPEHLSGRKLEVGYWIVHGPEGKLADNIHVVGGYYLAVQELILASLASGSLLTTAEERNQGVLVLDIGKGVTDYVLYRGGHVLVTGTLAVAGEHLSSDLSIGLNLTVAQADWVKVRHGRGAVKTRDKADMIWLNGDGAFGDQLLSKRKIEIITAARTAELFEIVKRKLGPAFAPEYCGAGIILTGGTSRLPGIEDAASQVFNLPARCSTAPSWVREELKDPMFSTVLGVLEFGLRGAHEHALPTSRKSGLLDQIVRSVGGAWGKALELFH
jgi:cell division protein FtsA